MSALLRQVVTQTIHPKIFRWMAAGRFIGLSKQVRYTAGYSRTRTWSKDHNWCLGSSASIAHRCWQNFLSINYCLLDFWRVGRVSNRKLTYVQRWKGFRYSTADISALSNRNDPHETRRSPSSNLITEIVEQCGRRWPDPSRTDPQPEAFIEHPTISVKRNKHGPRVSIDCSSCWFRGSM